MVCEKRPEVERALPLTKGSLCGERGRVTKPAAAPRYKRVRRGRLLWAWIKGHAPAGRREAYLAGLGAGGRPHQCPGAGGGLYPGDDMGLAILILCNRIEHYQSLLC